MRRQRVLKMPFIALVALFVVAGRDKPETTGEKAIKVAATEQGEIQYQLHCVACHGAGNDKPGTVALATRNGQAAPAELAKRTDLTADMVQYVVRNGMGNMPPFRKTEIGDADLKALADWLDRSPSVTGKPPPETVAEPVAK